jgi:hypothetical protein
MTEIPFAAYHQRQGMPFAGIIFRQQTDPVGVCSRI